jgi:3-oxoacyl-[acyl-carrier-protein] synthase III
VEFCLVVVLDAPGFSYVSFGDRKLYAIFSDVAGCTLCSSSSETSSMCENKEL